MPNYKDHQLHRDYDTTQTPTEDINEKFAMGKSNAAWKQKNLDCKSCNYCENKGARISPD